MERKSRGFLCLICLALSIAVPTWADEKETPVPFAAALSAGKFSQPSYNAVLFGSLHWKNKGRVMKSAPVSKISLIRTGKQEERVDLDLGVDGIFVLQLSPGACEIRSVFSEGRWYTLGHSFSLDKGMVCYVGNIFLDRSADQLDYYDYRFTIDTELNLKKFNQTGSAWSTAIRMIPAELRTQEGKMNLFVPTASAGIQSVKRQDKNLVKAAEQGDRMTVEQYLSAKRPVDLGDEKKRSPLMAALQAQETAIAERLLSAGASLEIKDEDQWTPLMFALGFSQPAFAKTAIEMGADVTPTSKTNWTPLHLAARYAQSENARLIVDRGADINARTNKGVTPLSMALQYSDEDLALFLLDRDAVGDTVENDGWTPLMTAVRFEKPNAARRLIQQGVDINRRNNDGWTALMIAIRHDQNNLALELLNKGADAACANTDGMTPLYFAAKFGSIELLQALLSKKVPVNPVSKDGWTPLHQALSAERNDASMLLIEHGADLSKKTKNGWTALHLALRNTLPEVAKLLIEKNLGVDEALPDGWTPLMLALRYNQAENARLLIRRKAGINSRNKDGWSPLMHALRYDQAENAKLLIEKGADPKTSIPNGWTALHFAIEYGQPENASLLIAKGAVKEALNPDGKTALMLAQAKGYVEIVRLLGGAPAITRGAPLSEPATGLSVSAQSWLPGLLGQFIPPRPGVRIIKADHCDASASLCSAQLEFPGTRKAALESFKQDLMAAGWRLDQAVSAGGENEAMGGNVNIWGLLNVIKDQYNITMLILSRHKSGDKTVVDVNLMNRNPGMDYAAFARQIPRVIVTPKIPTDRFLTDSWAFTLISADWCGSKIEKDMGFGTPKYSYTAHGEGMDLLKIRLLLESTDKKPIKDRFMKIDIRLRDKQGRLHSPVLVGTSSGDYFNLSQGGAQSALVPMQASSEMDWVFSLPQGTIVDALLWPGIEAIDLKHQ